MKKLLGSLLILAVVLGFSQFKDVPVNHWAYEAVVEMSKLGVISGMPDGTFQGNSPLTRYQAAVALHKLYTLLRQQAVPANVTNLINRVSTLEDLLSTAMTRLQKVSEDYREISSDLETLKNDVSNLKATLIDVKNIRMEVASQLQGQADILRSLDQRISELSSKISSLEARMGAVPTPAQPSAPQVTTPQQVTVEYAEKKYVDAKVQEVQAKLSTLENRLGAVEMNFINLQTAVRNTETTLKSYVEETLRVYTQNFEKKLEEIYARIGATGNYNEILGELGNVKVLVTKLQNDLDAQQKTTRALDARIGVVEGQVTALNTRVENLEKRVTQVERNTERIDTLERNLGALTARVTSAENKMKELEGANVQLRQKVDEVVANKPWMEDVNSVSSTLGKKISEVQTLAIAGIAVGIIGMIIGFAGFGK